MSDCQTDVWQRQDGRWSWCCDTCPRLNGRRRRVQVTEGNARYAMEQHVREVGRRPAPLSFEDFTTRVLNTVSMEEFRALVEERFPDTPIRSDEAWQRSWFNMLEYYGAPHPVAALTASEGV